MRVARFLVYGVKAGSSGVVTEVVTHLLAARRRPGESPGPSEWPFTDRGLGQCCSVLRQERHQLAELGLARGFAFVPKAAEVRVWMQSHQRSSDILPGSHEALHRFAIELSHKGLSLFLVRRRQDGGVYSCTGTPPSSFDSRYRGDGVVVEMHDRLNSLALLASPIYAPLGRVGCETADSDTSQCAQESVHLSSHQSQSAGSQPQPPAGEGTRRCASLRAASSSGVAVPKVARIIAASSVASSIVRAMPKGSSSNVPAS
jgi:hypothetical protein